MIPTTNGALPTRRDLEAEGVRVVVGVPLERTVPSQVFASFWAIAQRGWPLIDSGYGRTDVNRNTFAQTLLDSDGTHLLMLDLDHLHAPDVVERHARWALDRPDCQVIGGMHYRRGEPFDPCAFAYGADGSLYPLADWPRGGLIEVHALGHGSLLVHRSVFEQLAPPWWGYDYGRASEGVYPTEDMYFCYLCREAGIRLWVDTSISSPHLMTTVVTEEVSRAWRESHPERIAGGEHVR
jgi:hypothetical protein